MRAGEALLTVSPHPRAVCPWLWDRGPAQDARCRRKFDFRFGGVLGIAIPAGASLRSTAPGARARSHLGIQICFPRGPEPRVPSWWLYSPCGSLFLRETLTRPSPGERFAGVLEGARPIGLMLE